MIDGCISRILFKSKTFLAIIYLGLMLPLTSSDLPKQPSKKLDKVKNLYKLLLFGLAPSGVYHAKLVT